jgi:hypothetical protein
LAQSHPAATCTQRMKTPLAWAGWAAAAADACSQDACSQPDTWLMQRLQPVARVADPHRLYVGPASEPAAAADSQQGGCLARPVGCRSSGAVTLLLAVGAHAPVLLRAPVLYFCPSRLQSGTCHTHCIEMVRVTRCQTHWSHLGSCPLGWQGHGCNHQAGAAARL